MNRKLIALAVAGALAAPVAALADGSSVVLTGVIHGDIGFGQEKTEKGDKVYKRQPNIGTFATRWQIDGTEDLGWSKAIFSLAMDQQFAGPNRAGGGLATNNNQISSSSVSNRNSYVGLTGGWGTLKIGQNEHQYEIQQILQDPDPASESTYGTLSLMTSYGLSGMQGFTRRDPQSIWYTSPDFGGVTVDVAYITPAGGKKDGARTTVFGGGDTDCSRDALGNFKTAIGQTDDGTPVFPTTGGCFVNPVTTTTVKTDAINPQGFQLAAQWKSAFGLSLYGATAQYEDDGGIDSTNRALRLGAGFGTEVFQVDVAGEQLKFKDKSNNNETKRANFMVSGSVNLGQHHIRAALSFGRKAKFDGKDIRDSEGKLFYLGYGFTLSKRTELQVIYGKVDNKKNASFGGVQAAGNDIDRFGVGVRHSF
jgi:predicted porin